MGQIYELQKYIEKYGDIDLATLLKKVQGKKKYKCPVCKGKGSEEKWTWYAPPGMSDDSYKEYYYDSCPICRGDGYLQKELKPKMEQVGWE